MSFIRHAMTAMYLTGAFVSLALLGVAAAHGNSGWVLYHATLAALNTMWGTVEIAGLLRPGRGAPRDSGRDHRGTHRKRREATPPGGFADAGVTVHILQDGAVTVTSRTPMIRARMTNPAGTPRGGRMGTRDDHHALHTLRVRIAAAEQAGDQATADRLFAQALPIARRIRAERARTLTRAPTVL